MVNTALADLLAQKAALDKQIAELQREQREQAIAQVRSLMADFGLTMSDLGRTAAPPRPSAAKVAPKYRNPETGQTWSGRGLKPKWLSAALAAGRTLSEFAV